jgi:hypothetical protein
MRAERERELDTTQDMLEGPAEDTFSDRFMIKSNY